MLLSGVDTHRSGLGNMDEWTAPNQMGKPGYEERMEGDSVWIKLDFLFPK